METFLTVVLVVVLVFWLLKRLLPLLMVALISRLAKRGGATFYTNFGGPRPQEEPRKRPEGEVTVEVIEEQERRVSKSVGEYVEFEDSSQNKPQ